MTLTVDVGRDEEGSAADAGGAPASLHPVALHAGHQPQRCVCDSMELVADTQPVGKSVQIQAGVHRPERPRSIFLRRSILTWNSAYQCVSKGASS